MMDEENLKSTLVTKEKEIVREIDFSDENFNGGRPTNHRAEFP